MNSSQKPGHNLVDLCEHSANLKVRQLLVKQMADEARNDASKPTSLDADQLWQKIARQLPEKVSMNPGQRARLPIALLACFAAAVLAFLALNGKHQGESRVMERPLAQDLPLSREAMDLESGAVTASKLPHPGDEFLWENRRPREGAACNRTRQSC
ncbi:MAG TPA: hypothetical protein VE954_31760 [Oligoflexus sp.]|uniref:hypothetical protein n=1 Tax=Oligoflexus sp. TaxID=1971216 RepID=UPI002D67CEEA|nr:hypothetical protein [Oligoflexus sp.]HYX37701.1 hypothetical protein [Oligoflexus sp.]